MRLCPGYGARAEDFIGAAEVVNRLALRWPSARVCGERKPRGPVVGRLRLVLFQLVRQLRFHQLSE